MKYVSKIWIDTTDNLHKKKNRYIYILNKLSGINL